ncbi:MAG: response regulator transcription factor [Planctomycetaceae bacterium]
MENRQIERQELSVTAATAAEPAVFVVDNDAGMRKSLRMLIESVHLRVETFASGPEFLERYTPDRPGCLVLDIRMPGMSGLELQERLREREVNLPVIIVTGHGDVPTAVRAMKCGAVDFIEKPFSDEILLDLIQTAIARDQDNLRRRAEQRRIAARRDTLTRREIEVMDLVVTGLSSKEIADRLGVSFKTVEAHRAKIMKKMEARSIPQLIHMHLGVR